MLHSSPQVEIHSNNEQATQSTSIPVNWIKCGLGSDFIINIHAFCNTFKDFMSIANIFSANASDLSNLFAAHFHFCVLHFIESWKLIWLFCSSDSICQYSHKTSTIQYLQTTMTGLFLEFVNLSIFWHTLTSCWQMGMSSLPTFISNKLVWK